MRTIVPKEPAKKEQSPDDGPSSVSDVRKKWESRASTGSIGTKFKTFTSGAAKTVVGGTIGAGKTVAKGTLGATKTVAKGTFGATKTVVGGTIGATKTVAKGTFGATKTVVGGTVNATKTVAKGTYKATKTTGKSARDAIEGVALFASPRVVQKKLNIGKKTKKIGIPDAFAEKRDGDKEATTTTKSPSPVVKSPSAATSAAAPGGDKPKGPRGPKPMSIKEKARAYETAMQERAKKFDITPNAPGAAPYKMHGKRTSRLDKFSPLPSAQNRVVVANKAKKDAFPIAPFGGAPKKPTTTTTTPSSPSTPATAPKPQEEQQAPVTTSDPAETKKPIPEESLSPTSVGSLASESPEEEAAPTTTTEESSEVPKEVVEEDAKPAEEPEEEEEAKPAPRKSAHGQSSKIDREAIILQEIDEIIRIAEETEIYDEIDDETIEILKESALKSKAYTKRWYDAYTDSFIHCPSLAQTIVDYTLLEIAEDKFQELYEEEFPMLYTVGLRGVACNWVGDEEEVPDYIFDLAAGEGDIIEEE